MKNFWKTAGVAVIAASAWAAGAALAAWPERPIRMIVPFPAGQATDIYARFLAQRLGTALKQSVVVENLPGAGGTLGTERVTHAAADGYTLLLTASALAINQTLYRNIRYDARKDLDAVATVASSGLVIVATPESKITTLNELVAQAKAKPGETMYASAGIGGSQHLAAEMFKLQAGLDIPHVAYKGSAPALADFLGNRVPLMVDSIASALPHIRAGKAVPLAVTSAQRNSQLPNVPTVAESGFPGYEAIGWVALMAPKGTPAPILDRLNREVQEIFRTPGAIELLEKTGSTALLMSRPDTDKYVASEIDKWGAVVKKTGATVD